jgi:3-hydroxymyristoyl/3-hydroxydecanoyl-(acyl carrier protein) dehydratase
MSFSLVDRITGFEPGRSARGRVELSDEPEALPLCLLVEAVGQLAAWVAIHANDFATRPVAAVAGDVVVQGDAVPGVPVEIEIEITSSKRAAIGYRGRAYQAGTSLLVLERALGVLLPMHELNDPERVRAELELLRGEGFERRARPRPDELRPRRTLLDRTADRLRAEIRAPEDATVYADHFPRRPVYPATLLLDAQLALAVELLSDVPGVPARVAPRLARVRNVRVRSFTPPGGRLEVVVEKLEASSDGRLPATPGCTTVSLTATADGERVSTALADLRVGEPS